MSTVNREARKAKLLARGGSLGLGGAGAALGGLSRFLGPIGLLIAAGQVGSEVMDYLEQSRELELESENQKNSAVADAMLINENANREAEAARQGRISQNRMVDEARKARMDQMGMADRAMLASLLQNKNTNVQSNYDNASARPLPSALAEQDAQRLMQMQQPGQRQDAWSYLGLR